MNHKDEDESGDRPWKALENAMKRYSKGLPQEDGETLTIDSKNGYILYEYENKEYADHFSGWKYVTGTSRTENTNSLLSIIWQTIQKAGHV